MYLCIADLRIPRQSTTDITRPAKLLSYIYILMASSLLIRFLALILSVLPFHPLQTLIDTRTHADTTTSNNKCFSNVHSKLLMIILIIFCTGLLENFWKYSKIRSRLLQLWNNKMYIPNKLNQFFKLSDLFQKNLKDYSIW